MDDKQLLTEEENVIPIFRPQLITGGKGPPGTNWLKKLRNGTVFLCQNTKEKNFTLGQFHVNNNLRDCVQLLDNTSPGPEVYFWVDSQSFSQQFELKKILHEPEDGSD